MSQKGAKMKQLKRRSEDLMEGTSPTVAHQLPAVFCRDPIIHCRSGTCVRPQIKRALREWKSEILQKTLLKKRKTEADIAHSQERNAADGRVERVSESSSTDESWASGKGEATERSVSPPVAVPLVGLSGLVAQCSSPVGVSWLAAAQGSVTGGVGSPSRQQNSLNIGFNSPKTDLNIPTSQQNTKNNENSPLRQQNSLNIGFNSPRTDLNFPTSQQNPKKEENSPKNALNSLETDQNSLRIDPNISRPAQMSGFGLSASPKAQTSPTSDQNNTPSLSALASAQNTMTPSLFSLATAQNSPKRDQNSPRTAQINIPSLSTLATAQNSPKTAQNSPKTAQINIPSLSTFTTAQNTITPSLFSLATAQNSPKTAQNSTMFTLSTLPTAHNTATASPFSLATASTTASLATLATPNLSSLATASTTAQETDQALSLNTATQLQISIPKLKISSQSQLIAGSPQHTASSSPLAALPALGTSPQHTTASPLALPSTTASTSLSSLAQAHLNTDITSPLTIPPLNAPNPLKRTLTPPTAPQEMEMDEELVMESLNCDLNVTIDLKSALVTHERQIQEENVREIPPPVIESPQNFPHCVAMVKATPSPFGEVVADIPRHQLGERRPAESEISVPFSVFSFDTPSPDEEVQLAMNDPRNPARYRLIMQERQNRMSRA